LIPAFRKRELQKRIKKEDPKFLNIGKFIRLLEIRDENITEDVFYKTVVNKLK
jgi:hypothetical protein